MPTFSQLVMRNGRYSVFKRKCRLLALDGAPQKLGTCLKFMIIKPKKPNSAMRKIARVLLSNKRTIRAYVNGQGSQLIPHSKVLVRGGRTPDLPGLRFRFVKGVYDFDHVEKLIRKKSPSKYGLPRWYLKQVDSLIKARKELDN